MSVEAKFSSPSKSFSKKSNGLHGKPLKKKKAGQSETDNMKNVKAQPEKKKRLRANEIDAEEISPKKAKVQGSKVKKEKKSFSEEKGVSNGSSFEKGATGKKKRPLVAGQDNGGPPGKKFKFGGAKFGQNQNFKKGAPFKKGAAPGAAESTEKPDWNKVKEERKALRVKRRTAASGSDMYELSINAKKAMEPLRDRNCSKEVQIEQIPKVHSLLKGNLLAVVFSHDMSRVVEVLLKWAHTHSMSDIISEVTEELLPEIVKMSQCVYAAHSVRAMIDYCNPSQRTQIAKAFYGHVVKLLGHKLASGIIERLYSKLKVEDQYELRKELYGGSHKLLTSQKITGLSLIFEKLPTMKESTLTNTKTILSKILEKGLLQSHIVHSVLEDYLQHASSEDCAEILELSRAHLKALTGSKEGVHVVMKCLWTSPPKDRKKIIKDLKDEVVTLACKEFSYPILLTIFDIVDDTVIVQKAIIATLLDTESIPTLLSSVYGRKILMYLCSRRDPKMFTAADIAVLSPGDNNPHSKKDVAVRAMELQKFAVPLLLKNFAENSSLWIEDNHNILVLLSAILVGSGEELKNALQTLAKYVAYPPNSEENGIDLRVADDAGCHMLLKKVAQHDKVYQENGLATFGEALVSELTDEHYSLWLKNNRCCFLLLDVIKNASEEVRKKLQTKIKRLSSKVWSSKKLVPKGGLLIQKVL